MEWAGTMTTITQEDKDIIFACKESVLFNDNSPFLLTQGLLSLKKTDSLQAKMMSLSSCVMVVIVPAHSIAFWLLAFDFLFFRDLDVALSLIHDHLTSKEMALAAAKKMETYCGIENVPCKYFLNN